MAKIRVGQLAKELNLKVGEVLARLRELGAEVKSNLSTVEDEVADHLRSAAPSSEKRPAEAPKGAPPTGGAAAGGRATLKAPLRRQQPATQGVTPAPAASPPKGTSAISHVTPQGSAPRTAAVKATATPVRPAPKPVPVAPAARSAAPARTSSPGPARPAAAGGVPPASQHQVAQPRPATTTPAKPGGAPIPHRPQVATGPPRPGVIRGAVSSQPRPGSPPLPTTRPPGSFGPTGLKPSSAAARPLSGVGQPQRPLPPRGASAHPTATSAGAKPAGPARPGAAASPLRPVAPGE